MDNSTLRALRILAIQSVEDPTYEQVYAKICRWYSREFHTPLPEVEKMAEEMVFKVYFEDKYQSLAKGSEEEQAQYKKDRYEIVTDKRLEDLEKVVAQQDDDWIADLAASQYKQPIDNKGDLTPNPSPSPNLSPDIPQDLSIPTSGSFSEE